MDHAYKNMKDEKNKILEIRHDNNPIYGLLRERQELSNKLIFNIYFHYNSLI